MAVDTQDKRASAVIPIFTPPRIWPNPDSDLANTADRAHMAYLYRGVASSASAAANSGFRIMMGVGI